MLPSNGCHPEINVLFIGGFILKTLKEHKNINTTALFIKGNNELNVSTDHMILALDWLYVISAIDYKNNEITLNEVT
jgi:hypothetical protein